MNYTIFVKKTQENTELILKKLVAEFRGVAVL